MPRTITAPDIAREAALDLARGAHEEAERLGVAIALAVVDRGGNVVLLDRMDGAATCAAPLALTKAETAAATQAATGAWFDTTQPGGEDWGMSQALGGRFTAMPGGLPVIFDGAMVGAVGVSGGAASQDVGCARAALLAAGAEPDDG